ncbi:hypothetical protein BJ878DRAFT_548189, partial [Calycina marina]
IVNLDFDARVPIPVSFFPSSYRNDAAETTTTTHVEAEVKLPQENQSVGRERHSSFSANLPPLRGDFRQEEVHITREDHHRPSRKEDIYIREEHRLHQHYDVHLDSSAPRRRHYEDEVDVIERQYRSRVQPSTYREEFRVNNSVEGPRFQPTNFREESRVNTTVDAPTFQPTKREEYNSSEETVDPPRFQERNPTKMGYYDQDGHYHSLRHGIHRAKEHVKHDSVHVKEDIDINVTGSRGGSGSKSEGVPNTVTIPTHHIRLGDLLILQGRPCQVIRISTSSSTGQHRYLGVDLFTKQLHEESSFISNPSPSVIVQTMLGPVFKQYRVLDLQDGTVVAMTETGDVKQALPVIDQSNLWTRLNEAFDTGRGSVRVLVISDHGRELAVDMKVVHGSRL